MVRLKPGFIVSAKPGAFAGAIARAAAGGFPVTSGYVPPAGTKYVFTGSITEDTDLRALATALREGGLAEYTSAAGETVLDVWNFPEGKPRKPAACLPQKLSPQALGWTKPERATVLKDTAMVVLVQGADRKRVDAFRTALRAWLWLDPLPRIMVTELVAPGERQVYILAIDDVLREAGFHGGGAVEYSCLELDELHVGLFQKEAVINRMTRAANPLVRYVGSIDAEFLPLRQAWAGQWREELASGTLALQPFTHYSDTRDSMKRNIPSFCSARMRAGGIRREVAPGFGWCFNREWFQDIGGMNPFFVPGGGDTAWTLRLDPASQFAAAVLKLPWWARVFDETGYTPTPELAAAGGGALHVWHGNFVGRQYRRRNVALSMLTENILPGVELDGQGLVCSVGRLGRQIQYVCMRKAAMSDDLAMGRIVDEAKRVE